MNQVTSGQSKLKASVCDRILRADEPTIFFHGIVIGGHASRSHEHVEQRLVLHTRKRGHGTQTEISAVTQYQDDFNF